MQSLKWSTDNAKLNYEIGTYSNWSHVYEKALWIAKVLTSEFYYEELQEDIGSKKVNIENYGYANDATFENEMLVDNECRIERSQRPGITII